MHKSEDEKFLRNIARPTVNTSDSPRPYGQGRNIEQGLVYPGIPRRWGTDWCEVGWARAAGQYLRRPVDGELFGRLGHRWLNAPAASCAAQRYWGVFLAL